MTILWVRMRAEDDSKVENGACGAVTLGFWRWVRDEMTVDCGEDQHQVLKLILDTIMGGIRPSEEVTSSQ